MKHSIETLVATLEKQNELKQDYIVSGANMVYAEGNLIITQANTDVVYKPTELFHSQVADTLAIPKTYYDRMRHTALPLLDDNVNHWLKKSPKRLIRTFEDTENTARAFLSNRYSMIDNYEILFEALQALKATGIAIEVVEASLSETRMYLKVICPEIEVQAEELLKRYSKASQVGFGVCSGFGLQNSEVGKGQFQIYPRGWVRACSNGLILMKDAIKKVHLGAKMDELNFGENRQVVTANMRLIKEQIKHAINTFLSKDYLNSIVNFYTEEGKKDIEAPLSNVVEVVAKNYSLSEDRKNSILNYFIKGADTKRSGLVHAITEECQIHEDADIRQEGEVIALDVLTNFNAIEAQAFRVKPSSN